MINLDQSPSTSIPIIFDPTIHTPSSPARLNEEEFGLSDERLAHVAFEGSRQLIDFDLVIKVFMNE